LRHLINLAHSDSAGLKILAAENIRFFLIDFPDLEEKAIDAIYDLCEDPSSEVRGGEMKHWQSVKTTLAIGSPKRISRYNRIFKNKGYMGKKKCGCSCTTTAERYISPFPMLVQGITESRQRMPKK